MSMSTPEIKDLTDRMKTEQLKEKIEEKTADGPENFSGYNGLSIHPLDLPDEH